MSDRLVFQCFKENLLTALNTIYPAITAKDPIIAYRCANLQIVNNALQISGINREFSIIAEVSGRITANDNETISVDANLIRGAVASMTDNDTVYIKVSGTRMTLQASRRNYRLNCMEYGSLPTPELPSTYIGRLEQGTSGVFRGFYAGDDNGNLSAMRLDVKEGRLVVSATNQYRCASIATNMIGVSDQVCIALPKKSAGIIVKLFKDEAIEVYANDSLIGFKGTTAILISATMVFVPPDLTSIIPLNWAGSMKLPVGELKTMAETALMLLTESRCGKLIFNFVAPSVTVETSEQQLGSGSAAIVGEDAHRYNNSDEQKTVMVNMKYLIDALNGVTTDAVEVLVGLNNAMIGVRPEFSLNEIHIIMPMVMR